MTPSAEIVRGSNPGEYIFAKLWKEKREFDELVLPVVERESENPSGFRQRIKLFGFLFDCCSSQKELCVSLVFEKGSWRKKKMWAAGGENFAVCPPVLKKEGEVYIVDWGGSAGVIKYPVCARIDSGDYLGDCLYFYDTLRRNVSSALVIGTTLESIYGHCNEIAASSMLLITRMVVEGLKRTSVK